MHRNTQNPTNLCIVIQIMQKKDVCLAIFDTELIQQT